MPTHLKMRLPVEYTDALSSNERTSPISINLSSGTLAEISSPDSCKHAS
jgi:hypothetical protein